jgi:ATPase subunit of ABC transporter with duplicated ATPase domains
MSAENQEAHSSSHALPFRDGALSPAKIRDQCPQFRILIIGKANAGKTTILRKVCNAEPDAKPIIYDAKGKKIKQDLADVRDVNLPASRQINNLGSLWQLSRLRKIFGQMKGHSTDVLNPSSEVKQTTSRL